MGLGLRFIKSGKNLSTEIIMFGLFKNEEKKFPRLKLDMFDPLDQPITVETGKELVSNFLLEIGYARDKEKAKWFAMEFVEELKKDFRVVKKSFELERKEGKKCKLEVERIEKEIIELKDKKSKLKDEDEIDELEDEIENQKDTLKEEKDEVKNYLKEMTKLKTKLDNIKSDKKHALKKSIINYVNNIVHQEDKELIVGVDHMR